MSLFLIRRLVDTGKLFPRERKGCLNDLLRNPYFLGASVATRRADKNHEITVNKRTGRRQLAGLGMRSKLLMGKVYSNFCNCLEIAGLKIPRAGERARPASLGGCGSEILLN